MQDLLKQIKTGLDHNLYYLSLFTSLAIPDICGALTTTNGVATKDKYIEWFNINVGKPKQYFLTGEDCYYFRCSMIHQGRMQHVNSSFQRILFVEPRSTINTFHNNIILKSLNIDLVIFCNDIVESCTKWLETIKNDLNFIRNYDLFVRRYPNGIRPFIEGVPVIG